MIIFDLDGTLADCEHRRHFIDPSKRNDCYYHSLSTLTQKEGWYYKDVFLTSLPPKSKKFIPDWKLFFEPCDKDIPIEPTMRTFSKYWIGEKPCHVEIWSGRCESVREKTLNWFLDNWFIGLFDHEKKVLNSIIKMRPIGDYTPDEQLKERWLDEELEKGNKIDFVFDDRPKVVKMWRRRGIFVFDCNQNREEF